MADIQIGDKVVDWVSGLKGVAVARIEYLNGCVQFGVQAPAKDGKVPDVYYVDAGQLNAEKRTARRTRSGGGGPPSGYDTESASEPAERGPRFGR